MATVLLLIKRYHGNSYITTISPWQPLYHHGNDSNACSHHNG